MKIHFIGGAHEVGGSCSVVEVGARRLLVDCGQRMGGAVVDRLPDLARVQALGPIDAILVTHAHADHIGALPIIHLAYPQAPVYTSEATLALMRIMLADSLRIMQMKWMQEAEIPLYPEHAVESLLARAQAVRPGESVDLCGGEMQMTLLLSGHVLGACSLTLDTCEGRVLFTGDYSVDAQRTVDPFVVPKVRPQVVITEATYGNRLHANRKNEEMRLAESVAQVVAAGGKVLIPAFALGRAQEVLLILMAEQKAGRIPRFPIFVDGMVRTVCQAYSLFPEFLGERLRKQVEREGNPFFYEGSPARAVTSAERELVTVGEACCIVSSSGMLMGGPSQYYAAELAPDAKNAIFITGYQDEESPGGKVLALAEAAEPTLRLGDQLVRFECKIAKYNLSAHADAVQISSLVAQLAPKRCYLVHGDEGARQALAAMMPPSVETVLPQNGEMAEFSYGSSLRAATGAAYRPGALLAPAMPRSSAPFDYKKETSKLLATAKKALAMLSEVLHVGWRPDTHELLIQVAFPNVFQERKKALLEDLQQRIGASAVVVTAKNTVGELAALARASLPLGAKLVKPPSVFPDGRFLLKVRFLAETTEEQRQAFREKLVRETGLTLEFQEPEAGTVTREVIKADGRMELNAAYRLVRESLQGAGLLVFHCGHKPNPVEHIEIGLLAPWLLDGKEELIESLEKQIGYPLRAAGPNQPALDKVVRETLPPAWQVVRPLQWRLAQREVRLTLAREPRPEELEPVSQRVFERVGLRVGLARLPSA